MGVFVLHADDPRELAFVRDELVPALGLPPDQVRLSSELPLGATVIGALEDGIATSRVTVVVVSPAFLRDTWGSFGESLASHLAATGGVLVPLLLVDCTLPPRLDMKVRLDCRDPKRRAHELGRLRALVAVDATPAPIDQRIFLSYRHEGDEAGLATRLHAALTSRGHQVFIDVGMTVGTSWAQEISRQIAASDVFIVLVSEGSIAREMVQDEVRAAYRSQRRTGKPMILPVRIRYEGPLDYEMAYYLDRFQYVLWELAADDPTVLAHVTRAIAQGPTRAIESSAVSPPQVIAAPAGSARPSPAQDPRPTAPGGTLRAHDRFYIRRPCDELIDATAADDGQTLVIKAPRQRGKSSLLVRYLAACQARKKQIALIDFQTFDGADLETYPAFLQSFAVAIADNLGLDTDAIKVDKQQQMTRFVQRSVLTAARGPVVLALDEVDRIGGRAYKNDFFSMLRSWHNARASPNTQMWLGLDLALVLSTEPEALISDALQSPFNVSDPVEVPTFTRAQCLELNDRYGDRALLVDAVDDLYDYLGGHPYLTRLAFYEAQTGQLAVPLDRKVAADAHGPFGDHLRAQLSKLSAQPALLTALKQIIAGKTAAPDPIHRLHSLGLIRTDGGGARPANFLYAAFFRNL